jgi:hypothetical protein
LRKPGKTEKLFAAAGFDLDQPWGLAWASWGKNQLFRRFQ